MEGVAFIEDQAQKNPGAYAATSIPISAETLQQAQTLVSKIFSLTENPLFQQWMLEGHTEAALHSQGVLSLFGACDYHMTKSGLQLIEVNTHAGGAIAGALWQKALEEKKIVKRPLFSADAALSSFWEAFENEWGLYKKNGGRKLKTIAIVDDAPETQPYYEVEFVGTKKMLEERGIMVSILDASSLKTLEGIDLVYNRCCDFYFEEERHPILKEALLTDQCCFSPSPYMHALTAQKDILVYMTEENISPLIPETRFFSSWNREALWKERRHWVFKPRDRYQGKGVYRGDKISRTYFDRLPPKEYIVQRFVAPSETPEGLKTEIRFYHYGNTISFGVARLYHGQIMGFQDPRGGVAPLEVL